MTGRHPARTGPHQIWRIIVIALRGRKHRGLLFQAGLLRKFCEIVNIVLDRSQNVCIISYKTRVALCIFGLAFGAWLIQTDRDLIFP